MDRSLDGENFNLFWQTPQILLFQWQRNFVGAIHLYYFSWLVGRVNSKQIINKVYTAQAEFSDVFLAKFKILWHFLLASVPNSVLLYGEEKEIKTWGINHSFSDFDTDKYSEAPPVVKIVHGKSQNDWKSIDMEINGLRLSTKCKPQFLQTFTKNHIWF